MPDHDHDDGDAAALLHAVNLLTLLVAAPLDLHAFCASHTLDAVLSKQAGLAVVGHVDHGKLTLIDVVRAVEPGVEET